MFVIMNSRNSSMPSTEQRDELLALRYGPQDKPENIIWNDTITALLRHRSVRFYRPDPLPDGALETIVAAAQAASNSSNLHQWSVVAVTDPALKARIAETSRANGVGNPYIEQAPVFLLWGADLSRNNAIAGADGDHAIVHEYLDSLVMSTIDASLASQNAAIAAESLGLGICYIGAMRNDARAVAELIGLPKFSFVTFGMVVGYPDADAAYRIRPRPAQEVVLHRNRYDVNRSREGLEPYEEAMSAFRAELGMTPKTWKESARSSATEMAYMDGRENLRATLEDAGFMLR